MKLTITFIATDDMDEKNPYHLYEVESDNFAYYVCVTKEEIGLGYADYSNKYEMYNRSDFTDREWEIAKYLFHFLWNSDNGTNTCVERDIYEEDGFDPAEIKQFINDFHFEDAGVLEFYDDNGVEIYWDYFSFFNLKTCNFFEGFED